MLDRWIQDYFQDKENGIAEEAWLTFKSSIILRAKTTYIHFLKLRESDAGDMINVKWCRSNVIVKDD